MKHSERAQVLPIFAVSLIALMALAALSIDVSTWYYQQKLAQSAADAGAIAGATQCKYSCVPAPVKIAAATDAAKNYFTTNVGGATVTINVPPLSGPYIANSTAVEVIVQKTVTTFFAKFFGLTPTIKARAVAYENFKIFNCVYTLAGSLSIGGNGINAPNCGVVTNGNLDLKGGGNTGNVVNSVLYAGANNSSGNNGGLQNGAGTTIAPVHSIASSDPCQIIPGCAALITPPSPIPPNGSCTGACTPGTSGVCSYSPGTYTSLITPTSCTTVTFIGGTGSGNSGFYYLPSGMDLHNANTINNTGTVGSSGVTFYNVNGTITFPQTNFTLTAPPNGMLIYQPRANTNQLGCQGGGNHPISLTGILYLPGANFTTAGCDINNWLTIIAASIDMHGLGSSDLTSGTDFPTAIGTIVLGE